MITRTDPVILWERNGLFDHGVLTTPETTLS